MIEIEFTLWVKKEVFCLDGGIIDEMIERNDNRRDELLIDEKRSGIVKEMVSKKRCFVGVYTKKARGVGGSMSSRSDLATLNLKNIMSRNQLPSI